MIYVSNVFNLAVITTGELNLKTYYAKQIYEDT
jgi:hypothetical protein